MLPVFLYDPRTKCSDGVTNLTKLQPNAAMHERENARVAKSMEIGSMHFVLFGEMRDGFLIEGSLAVHYLI
jgi:hypothetical protein